jgi:hypothetical protein
MDVTTATRAASSGILEGTKEGDTMGSGEVQKVKEVMRRFDSSLVAAAIQELDIEESEYAKVKESVKQVYTRIDAEPELALNAMKRAQAELENEVIFAEVNRVKEALARFDRNTVLEAAAEYIGSAGFQYCISPECICPEGGCIGRIQVASIDHSIYEIEAAGYAQINAQKALEVNEKASAVIGVSSKVGFAGLCVDTVRCFGQQITVMHKCLASLYAFDLHKGDLVSTILKMAEQNPALHKNMSQMVSEMQAAGEL